MSFNLESGKSKEINETPEVKVDSEHLSETEETAENFDDCSLNEVQDSKGNEVNADSLEDAEENYDDCEAKMEEMEEKKPELAENDDDFNDCGKETDDQYVAEVTYTTDGEISQEEASAELQEAYNECDDPEDMQQLKENANENEHIEVHNAEVVERPENSEMGEEVTEEEYEQAQEKLDEAQENLEAQQEAAQEYQEDLENQINKHENEVPEGTKNINDEASERTEETESSNEVEEAIEETEDFDEVEETTEETEDSGEVEETTEETENSDGAEETTEETENSDEVVETTEETENYEVEEIGAEDLENMEDGSKVETSEIDEENLSENVSQEVEEETDTELSDETKEQIAEEVSNEINSEEENNEISATETEEIIEEKKNETVESLNEQSEAMDEEIEQKADEIAEQDDLTEKEAKEQISEEVSEHTRENISDDEVDAMVEEKSDTIEETIEEKAEEQETVDSVKETADELEEEKTEQQSEQSEQSEQSLQERIDSAFEKEDVTASEINSLRDEHSAELQAKIEEKSTTEAELKTKFDEVLSREKGTDEYRQSLQEYNALQDKKVELDEQITAMEKQQDLLHKKSLELERENQMDSTDNGIVAEEKTPMAKLTDYMNSYEYGLGDFDIYSQDPEWRELQRQAFPDYELPPIPQESAYRQLGKYMSEHNYGPDDFDTYSQDPKWRELQSYAFPDYELPPIKDDLKYKTTPVKEMIESQEYQQYKDIYKKLDTLDVSQEYKDVLVEKFVNMDATLKYEYNRYADKLVCLDTSYTEVDEKGVPQDAAYFSAAEGGFKFDQEADMNNPLGAGNTFFHESGHMLDWLKGQENGSYNASDYSFMTDAIHEDYYDALDKIQLEKNCDFETAQKLLSDELMSEPIASNCVSDVFGGVSYNKVSGAWGHDTQYWRERSRDAIGKEAFAELIADRACGNIASMDFAKKYLPRTLKAYERALKNGGVQ